MGEHNIPKVQLNIRLDQNGEISVSGPIHDKIFCLGIMEIAKRVILNHRPEQPKIVVPSLVTPPINKGS